MQRLKLLLLVQIFWLCTGTHAQDFSTFSELSGTPAYSYTMLRVPDGYIVAVHLIDTFESAYALYKIDDAGDVQNSLLLYNENEIHIGPQLFEYAGRFFVSGKYSARYQGDNFEEFLDSQRKFVFELDASLAVLTVNYFDIFEDKSWIWGPVVTQASGVLHVNYPGTHHIANDTLYTAQAYLKVKFEESENGLELIALDKVHVFEKVGLEGQVYDPGTELDNVSLFFSSVFTDNRFFVFGDVGGTPIGGGGIFDITALGEYSLQGNAVNTYAFDGGTSGLFSTGSTAQFHNGFLFTTYFASSVADVPGCVGASAAIDVRNPEGFSLVSRFKVPLCGTYTYCKEPFLFNPDGTFYFLGWTADAPESAVTLFKYSSDYSLQGSITLNLPGHRPTGIYAADGDEVVIACLAFSAGSQNATMQLFKVQSEALLNTDEARAETNTDYLYYPNPFKDVVHVQGLSSQATALEVIGMDGRSHGTYTFESGYSNLGHLPDGVYLMTPHTLDGNTYTPPHRMVKVTE